MASRTDVANSHDGPGMALRCDRRSALMTPCVHCSHPIVEHLGRWVHVGPDGHPMEGASACWYASILRGSRDDSIAGHWSAEPESRNQARFSRLLDTQAPLPERSAGRSRGTHALSTAKAGSTDPRMPRRNLARLRPRSLRPTTPHRCQIRYHRSVDEIVPVLVLASAPVPPASWRSGRRWWFPARQRSPHCRRRFVVA